MSKKMRLFLYWFVVLAIIATGCILGYHQITPTKAPNNFKEEMLELQDTAQGKADFRMILNHDYQISKQSHPSGSDSIKLVQNYIKQQLDIIGCGYETQDFKIDMKPYIEQELSNYNAYMNDYPDRKKAYEEQLKKEGFPSYEAKYRSSIGCIDNEVLEFKNFLVKLDAQDTDNAILFMSHYDSVSSGPGAADDAISSATMLEVLREQYQKGGYQNDIYFLFTDGEELELFGAEAFVNKYTNLRDEIKLVINLEARGNSGTLIMFETSLNNKNIVKALNKALTHNSMFSMTAAVYRTMPNDTDLTKFLEAGYPGVNFSVIGNPENYHAKTDSYVELDRDSAYMYYTSAVELADYFGKAELSTLESKEDAVYFPFLKENTIILSNLLAYILSCVLGVLTFAWLIFLAVKKVYKITRLIRLVLGQIILISITVVLSIAGTFLYTLVMNNGDWYSLADTLDLIFYALCLICIIITMLWLWRSAGKAKNASTLLPGSILLFNLLNWICTFAFNSLAYIFSVPLLFLFIYSVYTYLHDGKDLDKPVSYGYLVLQGIITCLLYVPCIYLLYTALLSGIFIVVLPLTALAVLPIAVIASVMLHSRSIAFIDIS